jgi:hypothetical protein
MEINDYTVPNQLLTSAQDSVHVNPNPTLTFNGTVLALTGNMNASGTIATAAGFTGPTVSTSGLIYSGGFTGPAANTINGVSIDPLTKNMSAVGTLNTSGTIATAAGFTGTTVSTSGLIYSGGFTGPSSGTINGIGIDPLTKNMSAVGTLNTSGTIATAAGFTGTTVSTSGLIYSGGFTGPAANTINGIGIDPLTKNMSGVGTISAAAGSSSIGGVTLSNNTITASGKIFSGGFTGPAASTINGISINPSNQNMSGVGTLNTSGAIATSGGFTGPTVSTSGLISSGGGLAAGGAITGVTTLNASGAIATSGGFTGTTVSTSGLIYSGGFTGPAANTINGIGIDPLTKNMSGVGTISAAAGSSSIGGVTLSNNTITASGKIYSGGFTGPAASTINGISINPSNQNMSGVGTLNTSGTIATAAGFTGTTVSTSGLIYSGGFTGPAASTINGISINPSNQNMSGVGTLGCGAITSSGALGLSTNDITSGNHVSATTNTYTLGTAENVWNNVYATTFTGALTGNVTGNCSGSSGSCTGNAAGLTGSPSITVTTLTATTVSASSTSVTHQLGNMVFSNNTISWVGDGGYDTGLAWVSDGVFNIMNNAIVHAQFNTTGLDLKTYPISNAGTISSAAITATGSNVIGGVTMNNGDLSWAQYSNFATGNGNTNTRMFGSYMAVSPLYNSDFFITNNMQTITLPTSSATASYYNKIVSATKDSAGYGQSAIRLQSYANGGAGISFYNGIATMLHVGSANVVVGNTTGGGGFEGFYNGVSTGLTVFGSNNPLPSATTGVATLQVMSTEAVGTDVGASIGLGGRSTDYGGGAQFQTFGRISGGSSGAGGYSGFLSFATMGPADGSLSEKMRILAAGNVGIGTSTPGSKLDVNGTISATTNATTTGAASLVLNGIFFPATPVVRPGFQVVFYQYSSGYTSSTVFSLPTTIKAGIVLFNFVQDNDNYINIPMFFNSQGVYVVAGTFSGNLSVAATASGKWTITNMTSATFSRGSLMYLGSFNG